MAFFRSRYSKTEVRSYIHRSESTDDGRTWSPPIAMNLPNPNKSVQACVLESGALMIVFNNNRGGVIRVRLSSLLRISSFC